MDIRTIKLITGEEIFGDLVEDSNGEITVNDPLLLAWDSSTGEIAFRPWVWGTLIKQHKFSIHEYLVIAKPSESFITLYENFKEDLGNLLVNNELEIDFPDEEVKPYTVH